ncbi:MAG: flagellar basal body-associated FliL family protein [Pseudomonadota bacterium]
MKLIVPLLLTLVGALLGAGTGVYMRMSAAPPPCDGKECAPEPEETEERVSYDYVDLGKQFVVPVMGEDAVTALVVLSIVVEVAPEAADLVRNSEPKIRDMVLQVLFRHAQSGGFDGAFTTGQPMRDLRMALTEVVVETVGDGAKGVLVTDVVRQDM